MDRGSEAPRAVKPRFTPSEAGVEQRLPSAGDGAGFASQPASLNCLRLTAVRPTVSIQRSPKSVNKSRDSQVVKILTGWTTLWMRWMRCPPAHLPSTSTIHLSATACTP